MKQIFMIAMICFTFLACDKKIKEPIKDVPSKNMKEALARLGAVKSWKISTITFNNVLAYENVQDYY